MMKRIAATLAIAAATFAGGLGIFTVTAPIAVQVVTAGYDAVAGVPTCGMVVDTGACLDVTRVDDLRGQA